MNTKKKVNGWKWQPNIGGLNVSKRWTHDSDEFCDMACEKGLVRQAKHRKCVLKCLEKDLSIRNAIVLAITLMWCWRKGEPRNNAAHMLSFLWDLSYSLCFDSSCQLSHYANNLSKTVREVFNPICRFTYTCRLAKSTAIWKVIR